MLVQPLGARYGRWRVGARLPVGPAQRGQAVGGAHGALDAGGGPVGHAGVQAPVGVEEPAARPRVTGAGARPGQFTGSGDPGGRGPGGAALARGRAELEHAQPHEVGEEAAQYGGGGDRQRAFQFREGAWAFGEQPEQQVQQRGAPDGGLPQPPRVVRVDRVAAQRSARTVFGAAAVGEVQRGGRERGRGVGGAQVPRTGPGADRVHVLHGGGGQGGQLGAGGEEPEARPVRRAADRDRGDLAHPAAWGGLHRRPAHDPPQIGGALAQPFAAP